MREQEEEFPWSTVMNMNPKIIQKRRELRKILLKYHRIQPRNVYHVRNYFDIQDSEWQSWLQNDEKVNKQSSLKEAVLAKSTIQPLTLMDFKRLARKYYKSKLFRPSDSWSFNFINRHNLFSNVNCSHLYGTLWWLWWSATPLSNRIETYNYKIS